METKVIAMFALVVVAAFFVSKSECFPRSAVPPGFFVPNPEELQAEIAHLRQPRQYFGNPGYGGYGGGGYGGYGGYGGGASSSAAASASAAAGGGGYGHPHFG